MFIHKWDPLALDAAGLQKKLQFDAGLSMRRKDCAKRLTLRVRNNRREIVVVAPLEVRTDEMLAFVERHQEWIRERLAQVPLGQWLEDGQELLLWGFPYRISFRCGRKKTPSVGLVLKASPNKIVVNAIDKHSLVLKRWLVAQAKRELTQKATYYAQQIGVQYTRIQVRDQISRWGSCSSSGTLAYSWRLVMAPSSVFDYVCAHEVAHLKEMNHGPSFWEIVRLLRPDYEAARAWLQKNGALMHAIGNIR